jgi:hypothetical protein
MISGYGVATRFMVDHGRCAAAHALGMHHHTVTLLTVFVLPEVSFYLINALTEEYSSENARSLYSVSSRMQGSSSHQ